jgi:hypothetical protein
MEATLYSEMPVLTRWRHILDDGILLAEARFESILTIITKP